MRSLFSTSSVLVALVALCSACGATTATLTGAHYAPREASCEFELLTPALAPGYDEIGTIDVSRRAYATNVYTDLSAFGDHIRPDVCAMGGDGVVAVQSGFGAYTRATVLKKVEQGMQTAHVADARTVAGCQVDTQCKGDRVCVAGVCVDPLTK